MHQKREENPRNLQVFTDEDNVFLSSSIEKWHKGKDIVSRWTQVYNNFDAVKQYDALRENEPLFSHKQLQKDQGFMIHLGRTYISIIPF